MDIKVKVEKKIENCYIVYVEGSLDSETYQEFEKPIQTILSPNTVAIVLDFANLDYISSIGFSIIFKIKAHLERYGGKLIIANLKANVKKIFDAVKAIPEALFVSMESADEYIDKFIEDIAKKQK